MSKATDFFNHQLAQWPAAAQRYRDLKQVQTRTLHAGHLQLRVQWNPARMVSTGAAIDKKTLQSRPCFLCKANRPMEQEVLLLTNHAVGHELLVNPFPILPMHFTIVLPDHRPQSIYDHASALYTLLEQEPELTVFYNGPHCGASAPDHGHLQAGSGLHLPLQEAWPRLRQTMQLLYSDNNKTDEGIFRITDWLCPVFAIYHKDMQAHRQDDTEWNRLISYMPLDDACPGEEPNMNLLAWREDDGYVIAAIPRSKHRPDCYYAENDTKRLVSPGALDMAGLVITPCQEDFMQLTSLEIVGILQEVSWKNDEYAAL